jgi:anti-sigma-K factor RskA
MHKWFWVGVVATSMAGGCGTFRGDSSGSKVSQPLAVSSVMPSAQGRVTLSPGKGDNQKLKVEVKHLAAPERVAEGATVYVVWLQPEGKSPRNIGVLNVNSKMEGKLETETVYKDFDVFVTAEPLGATTAPSNDEQLMTASVRGTSTM